MSNLNELLENQRMLREAIQANEQAIFEHMRDNLVEEAIHDGVKATLKDSPVWDEETLDMLREYVDESEYRNKPSVPTWNKLKIKKLAKSGGDVAKIVKQAQQMQPKFSVRVSK